jgi:hypothetical protein
MDAEILYLTNRLDAEGKKTQEFFASLADEQFNKPIYSDGATWNVRQVLAHFVATETAILDLLREIVQGGKGTPDGFNLDQFNQARVNELDNAPVTVLLQEYGKRRDLLTAFVGNLSAADLARTGIHPFLGQTDVENIVKLVYRHNQIHIREIRKFL